MLTVKGQKVLKIGDLHYDDLFTGRHFNYWENLIDVTERIQKVIEFEKPDLTIIAGDLIGVRRGVATLRDRNALLFVAQFLKSLGLVVVVKGNHDYAEASDYEFLSSLGVFKSTSQVKSKILFTDPTNTKECYIHLVDYGQENEDLDIDTSEGVHNVAVMHNEFYVEGKERQIHSKGAIELSSKRNFFGLDLILSGHIHTPTDGIIDFNFQNGHDCGFINLGCPSRPSYGELYDHCWYVVLEYTKDTEDNTYNLSFRQEVINLKPYEKIFRPSKDFIEDQDNDIDEFTGIAKGNLEDILKNIVTTNMGSDDFFSQVDMIQLVDEETKELAKQYLRKAMNM